MMNINLSANNGFSRKALQKQWGAVKHVFLHGISLLVFLILTSL